MSQLLAMDERTFVGLLFWPFAFLCLLSWLLELPFRLLAKKNEGRLYIRPILARCKVSLLSALARVS